jgi:hypothetical protein
MKHLKKFEVSQNTVDLFKDIYDENPNKDTHDFYMFIAHPDFIETEGGLYKKTIDIENMVRITPDEKSLSAANFLELRARFQNDSTLYHIWLPKELRKEIEGKGSGSIEEWLIDLIDKHKMRGSDEHGRQVAKDVKRRKEDIEKYNL